MIVSVFFSTDELLLNFDYSLQVLFLFQNDKRYTEELLLEGVMLYTMRTPHCLVTIFQHLGFSFIKIVNYSIVSLV